MTAPKAPSERGVLDSVAVFLATGLSLSLLPLRVFRALPVVRDHVTEKWSGCGLVGSMLGTATYLAVPLPYARSPLLLILGVAVSVLISARAEQVMGVHDDTRIVIDEWIGAWIAAAAAPHMWSWPLVLSFVLFRVFDVIKWPFGRLQKLPGGWGVTMDDVAAGLIAFALLRVFPLS